MQGLAQRADGSLWSVEHGSLPRRRDQPDRDRPRLRLEPGPGLRRERPDDRQPPPQDPVRRAVELRPHHHRPLRRRLRQRLALGQPRRHPRGRGPQGRAADVRPLRQRGPAGRDRRARRGSAPAAGCAPSPHSPTAPCWSPPTTAPAGTWSCRCARPEAPASLLHGGERLSCRQVRGRGVRDGRGVGLGARRRPGSRVRRVRRRVGRRVGRRLGVRCRVGRRVGRRR
ncbi:hypothetical protein G5V59_00880 [Nocardioides sp. W3-2-3]|uniref:hypothetical protein n=1 Tax=Nocardioides convexus TaxID=2712224 RepID=UPI0024185A05|nr:hypothetical protein [Nocardioides convexus]NGZ99476.1 hypothetical protein [Nocardioides convexus]